jgi:hypothetical protein
MQSRDISAIQVDLITETIDAALRTDSEEKVRIIARLLRVGLEAPTDEVAMAAKRFARTVGRLDELEFRVVLGFRGHLRGSRELRLKEIEIASNITNPDLVRTALSILVSEGLVSQKASELEKWELTDFGHRFLSELTAAYSKS